MSIKIMNTLKDHYSTEVLQQQQQLTLLRNLIVPTQRCCGSFNAISLLESRA